MTVPKRDNGDASVDSLRQLMAGTAHDLNNLLVLVNGCAELALLEDTLSPRARQLMSDILDAGERATSLTRQFLDLGRPPVLLSTGIDVAALLTSSATLLQRLVGDGITVSLDVGTAPLWVLAEASQLEQVIVNLVLNARDAMAATGTVAITAGAVARHSAAATAGGRPRDPEPVARLTVADTGSGIDPAIRERLYEPYATTKSIGKGSGLGLAVVRGIVDGLGGSIDVATSPGTGTTFAIDLPLAPVPGAPNRAS